MRVLAVLLALLFPLLATCQLSDDRILILNLDQCDELITQGDAYTQESINLAADGRWNESWRFGEEGFMSYLAATNVCTDDRSKFADQQLEQSGVVRKIITCTFHVFNVRDAQVRSKLAYDEIRDYDQSLRHARFALYSIEEALKWCPAPEDQQQLIETRTSTLAAVVQIEEMIAWQNEHSE